MTEYVTTNVRLPKEIYRLAKRRAHEEEKSLAEVIRESLAEYLVAASPRPSESDTDDPIFHLAELVSADEVIEGERPTDTSVRHDLYLYGADLDETAAQEEPNG